MDRSELSKLLFHKQLLQFLNDKKQHLTPNDIVREIPQSHKAIKNALDEMANAGHVVKQLSNQPNNPRYFANEHSTYRIREIELLELDFYKDQKVQKTEHWANITTIVSFVIAVAALIISIKALYVSDDKKLDEINSSIQQSIKELKFIQDKMKRDTVYIDSTNR